MPIEHLGREVIDDLAVVAGERRNVGMAVGASAQRQADQLQSGRPALGVLLEAANLVLGQVELHAVIEQASRLLRGEPQILGAELEQLRPRTQPSQRERRIIAAGHGDLHRIRQVIDDELHRAMDIAVLDLVVVVEHEHELVLQLGQGVYEHRHGQLGHVGAGGAQRRVYPAPEVGLDDPQRGQDSAPEAHRVVVAIFEREPRERPLLQRAGVPAGQ